jgi:DNA-binding MarR family transcriptional regulator/GNAT superfamily N-acetyltransferase
MPDRAIERRVAALRRFNRFYSRRIGALDERHLRSPFSLAEARVLYELARRKRTTAGDLIRALGLDAGYLSRIVGGFVRRGLVARTRAVGDRRQRLLALTRSGRAVFAGLDRRARSDVAKLLGSLAPAAQAMLIEATARIEHLLSGTPSAPSSVVLRRPAPGDLGYVVGRQAALYATEHGWNAQFEALVAGIVARFIERFDPARERCWIAERDGVIVGSVFLVMRSRRTAQLRMLYVEPAARGEGLGSRLVEECIRFARGKGYRRLVLWTNDVLVAARRIYVACGFRLARSERHRSFGKRLVGQYWELAL